jgi:hypothetical protein
MTLKSIIQDITAIGCIASALILGPATVTTGVDYLGALNYVNIMRYGYDSDAPNEGANRWAIKSETEIAAMALNTLQQDQNLGFLDRALVYYGRDAVSRKVLRDYVSNGGNMEEAIKKKRDIGSRTIVGLSGDL